MLSGIFWLGMKFEEPRHQELERRLSNALESHDFLTRYLAYMIDWRLQFGRFEPTISSTTPEAKQAEHSRSVFVDLLAPWYAAQGGKNAYIVTPVFDKTWRDSIVHLSDGTTWPVPPEVKEAVRERAGLLRKEGAAPQP